MVQICPKCAYVRKPDETTPADTCPACGIIYSKYIDATTRRNSAIVDSKKNLSSTQRPNYLVKIIIGVAVFAAASIWYATSHKVSNNFKKLSVPLISTVEQREFTDLFDHDIGFSSLATQGKYTVVEVYLDQCTYCRELEAAFGPFREKRSDVDIVRVHHPGRLNNSISATSREELEAKMNAMKTKMDSYQLCGSPHVEIFGPDKRPLGLDTCKHRDGTAFLWDWIGSETGIQRRSAPGLFSQM